MHEWPRCIATSVSRRISSSFGLHSAAALIALVYLGCADVVIDLPR